MQIDRNKSARIAAMVLTAFLFACADDGPKQVWAKAGASDSDFEADFHACDDTGGRTAFLTGLSQIGSNNPLLGAEVNLQAAEIRHDCMVRKGWHLESAPSKSS